MDKRKGFKAFGKGMICKGKQYAENTIFEDDDAVPCEKWMHYCIYPLDVFEYYPFFDNKGNFTEFAEVEALDDPVTNDNKKFCTTKLKIGSKIPFKDYIKAAFKVTCGKIKEEAKADNNAGGVYSSLAGGNGSSLAGGNGSSLAGGSSSKLAGGDHSILASGNDSTLAGGSYSALAGGSYSALIAGVYSTLAGCCRSTLIGGNGSSLAGGNGSSLIGGACSKLAGGNGSSLIGGNESILAGGNYSVLAGGDDSLIISGNESIAKGGIGSVITLVKRQFGKIVSYKTEFVDGKRIKADTFYKLEDGEFKEVDYE